MHGQGFSQTHLMTPSDASGGLKGCVPVSTAGPHVQYSETHSDFELVKELINRGWNVGCDGELLPSRDWFEGNA